MGDIGKLPHGALSDKEIRFIATVWKVQTLTDEGIRITLDTSEDAIMQAAQLMECKRFGAVLEVVITPRIQENECDTGKSGKIHI